MKVALVVHDFDPAFGQGSYCLEIVRRLREHCQFTIHSAAFRVPEWDDVTRHLVPTWRANVVTTIFSFLAGVGPSLRHAAPDLIHAQGLTCWGADVITAHVCNAARLRHMGRSSWRARTFTRCIAPLERAFYRQRRARHLIAISGVLARELQAEYGWQRPLSVIHHGTDAERFRPPANAAEQRALRQRFQVPLDAWTWLFMGEAVKGLAQVVDQLAQFPQAHLLVVTRSATEPYRTQAAALGIGSRITFHGFDPQPEFLHRAADVFVYPSNYDTFGLVVTEAMASGLAVVAGRNIGAAELITSGRDGMLCDPEDPKSLAAALDQLASDPGAARNLAAAGRQVIQRQSWDACAAATLQVYEEALRAKLTR